METKVKYANGKFRESGFVRIRDANKWEEQALSGAGFGVFNANLVHLGQ